MTTHTRLDLTKNQSLVFDALSGAQGPLSAYTILDQVRGQGIRAPLQVYRALDKLVACDLVHRLESLNAFVVCSQPNCDTHETAAFAICEICGHVREFVDEYVSTRLKGWTKDQNFDLYKTTIELRGRCGQCT